MQTGTALVVVRDRSTNKALARIEKLSLFDADQGVNIFRHGTLCVAFTMARSYCYSDRTGIEFSWRTNHDDPDVAERDVEREILGTLNISRNRGAGTRASLGATVAAKADR